MRMPMYSQHYRDTPMHSTIWMVNKTQIGNKTQIVNKTWMVSKHRWLIKQMVIKNGNMGG